MNARFTTVVQVVLGSLIGYTISRIGWITLKYTIGKALLSKRRKLKAAGEWAVVSGGSSGIGKGFAMEFAKDGFNVLLISNQLHELQETCSQIINEFGVNSTYINTDMRDVNCFEMLRQAIDDLSSVACIVNSAGSFGCFPCLFPSSEKLSPAIIDEVISINCTAATCLTHAAMPKLLLNRKNKPFIIFLGSLVGEKLPRGYTVYASTKSYIHAFSVSLRRDLAGTGVRVQHFTPSVCSTPMSGVAPIFGFVPTGDEYAKSAIGMLGVEETSCGYFFHELYMEFRYFLQPCLHYLIKGKE